MNNTMKVQFLSLIFPGPSFAEENCFEDVIDMKMASLLERLQGHSK